MGKKSMRDWAAPYGDITGEVMAPFVATQTPQIDRALALADITGEDVLCDLGCGSGSVVLRAAETRGCGCVGVDVNSDLILKARAVAAQKQLTSVRFVEDAVENFLQSTAAAEVTVIFLYLL